jgi:hypothetical protein
MVSEEKGRKSRFISIFLSLLGGGGGCLPRFEVKHSTAQHSTAKQSTASKDVESKYGTRSFIFDMLID